MLFRIVLGTLGFLVIIFGMALTLRNWHNFELILQVLIGPVIAIVGLVMMFYASIKNKS